MDKAPPDHSTLWSGHPGKEMTNGFLSLPSPFLHRYPFIKTDSFTMLLILFPLPIYHFVPTTILSQPHC